MEGETFNPLHDPMYTVVPIKCAVPNCPASGEVAVHVAGKPADFGHFYSLHGEQFVERLNKQWNKKP